MIRSETAERLRRKLITKVNDDSWEIAKLFITTLHIDLNIEFNSTSKSLDLIRKEKKLDIPNLYKNIIMPVWNRRGEKLDDASSFQPIELSLLMASIITLPTSKSNSEKLELFFTPHELLLKLFFTAQNIFSIANIDPKLKSNHYLTLIQFGHFIIKKISLFQQEIIAPKSKETIFQNLINIRRNMIIFASEHISDENKLNAELDEQRLFLTHALYHENKKLFFEENEAYLLCMFGIYRMRQVKDMERFTLLSILNNAKKGIEHGHYCKELVLFRVYLLILDLQSTITIDNVLTNENTEELAFLAKILKEIIAKNMPFSANFNSLRPSKPLLSSERLDNLSNILSNLIEDIKQLQWNAVKNSLTEEDRDFISLENIDKRTLSYRPLDTIKLRADPANHILNESINKFTQYYIVRILNDEFTLFLIAALHAKNISFICLDENAICITSLDCKKMQKLPLALQSAREAYLIKQKNTSVKTMAFDHIDSSSSESKDKKLIAKEKEPKPYKLSAKAREIIEQNKNKKMDEDIKFTDTLIYSDKSTTPTIFRLRSKQIKNLYATIDPKLIKLLNAADNKLLSTQLVNMLDVGNVLDDSKGRKGSIISGKPLDPSQSANQDLYIKVKDCDHAERFFGNATHKKTFNGKTHILLSVNMWRPKKNKKIEKAISDNVLVNDGRKKTQGKKRVQTGSKPQRRHR